MDFLFMVFKLIFALIIVLGLLIISLKYSNKGLSKFTTKRYVKVVDRMQISKDSYVIILKIGNKGMVLLTNTGHTERLQELSSEEIENIEASKKESYEKMTNVFDSLISKIKSKEDKDEK